MTEYFKPIAYSEGISFLLLLSVAMPMKYVFGIAIAVQLVGWIHGLLFILYVWTAYQFIEEKNWSNRDFGIAVFAGLIPFGPFLFRGKLDIN
jgi:integral membrane protein